MQTKTLFAAFLAFTFSQIANGGIIAQLDNSTQAGSSGNTLIFSVTLTNSSTTDQVWLNGISSTAASPLLSIDTSPFDANAPFFLDPLASSGRFELFDVTIAPGTPAGPYIGSIVSLIGGADGGNGTALNDLVDISFDVNVTRVAPSTPEPGTFGLLSVAMAVAVFVRHLQRRNAARSALLLSIMLASMQAAEIKTVHFMSEDHTTRLVSYLFEPAGPAPHPAIVLLHGRAGPIRRRRMVSITRRPCRNAI